MRSLCVRFSVGQICTLVCVVAHCGASLRADDELLTRYMNQLRARQLFTLAESYCLRQLSDRTKSPSEYFQLSRELSNTYVEHARHVSDAESAGLWQQAHVVITAALERTSDTSSRRMLRIQSARVDANRGDHLRHRHDLSPFDGGLRDQATRLLHEAIKDLVEIEKELKEAPQATRAQNQGTAAPAQLRRLISEIQLQIGQCYLNLALLQKPTMPDRVDALIQADQWLRKFVASVPRESDRYAGQVLLARVAGLRGDIARATRMLSDIEQKSPVPEVMDRVIAERVRLLLLEKNPTDAAQLVSQYRRDRLKLTGELQFLNVQSLIGLWKIADAQKQSALAAQLMQRIGSEVATLEIETGGYWAARGRMNLDQTLKSQKYGEPLAQQVEAASRLFGAGRTAESIQMYGQAAVTAHRQGFADLAAELGFTRASIQLKSGQFGDAAISFRELIEHFPKDPHIPRAHLLWAFSLGQLRKQQTDDQLTQKYVAALLDHLGRYPNHETTPDVNWMLAQFDEENSNWESAIARYEAIPVEHRRRDDSKAAIAVCYEKIIQELIADGQSIATWRNVAQKRLSSLLTSSSSGDPSRLEWPDSQILLSIARIYLWSTPPNYTAADPILQKLISNDIAALDQQLQEQDFRIRRRALLLRIVSLAGRDRMAEAESVLQEVSNERPSEMLDILEGLARMTVAGEPLRRRNMGKLQLQIGEHIDKIRGDLNDEQRLLLDRSLINAYLATGQQERAFQLIESLRKSSAIDPALGRSIAEALGHCETRECFEQARQAWLHVQSGAASGSREWIEARYHIARCDFELGNYAACLKLLRVTRLVAPSLGDQALQEKFRDLEAQAKKKNSGA